MRKRIIDAPFTNGTRRVQAAHAFDFALALAKLLCVRFPKKTEPLISAGDVLLAFMVRRWG